MTAVGLARLWRAGKRADVPWSTETFVGALFLGWGLFNFVEGMIDHQILGVHHVHPGAGQLAWDLGFLALALAMVAGDSAAVHDARGRDRATRPRGGTRLTHA